MNARTLAYRIAISLIFCLGIAPNVSAEYKSSEILFISWGDGIGQLKIAPAVYDSASLPADTIEIETASGPDIGFVDRQDNVYISSGYLNYLKGFDKSGKEILNFAPDYSIDNYGSGTDTDSLYNVNYDSLYYGFFNANEIHNFYVDSLSRIYLESLLGLEYIPVYSRRGRLLEKITYADDYYYPAYLTEMKWNSDDVLNFLDNDTYEYYTYRNGELKRGGAEGWRARDGFYYSVSFYAGDDSIEFIRSSDPGSLDYSEEYSSVFRPARIGNAYSSLLGISDDFRIFVDFTSYDSAAPGHMIRIYNNSCDEVDAFDVPQQSANKYNWSMTGLFLRPVDGAVYEFICKDDGLHVIRWAKI